MSAFRWTDPDGCELTVRTSEVTDSSAVIHVFDPSDGARVDLVIPHSDAHWIAASVATAICEAAGVPAPVVLERPASTLPSMVYAQGAQAWRTSTRVYVTGDGGVGMPAADARYLAACLAIYADEADAEAKAHEPDPAEVEHMAAALRLEFGYSAVGPEQIALFALRWMRRNGRAQP